MSESKKVALRYCTCAMDNFDPSMDTQYFFETCAYCEQKDQQKKADLVKADAARDLIKKDAARDRMKADAHAIEQVNNAALKLADKNPKAMFLVEWERNEDGNMTKGKKQDQKAKVLIYQYQCIC